eukprot:209332-Rhodomonas_salina.8
MECGPDIACAATRPSPLQCTPSALARYCPTRALCNVQYWHRLSRYRPTRALCDVRYCHTRCPVLPQAVSSTDVSAMSSSTMLGTGVDYVQY